FDVANLPVGVGHLQRLDLSLINRFKQVLNLGGRSFLAAFNASKRHGRIPTMSRCLMSIRQSGHHRADGQADCTELSGSYSNCYRKRAKRAASTRRTRAASFLRESPVWPAP